MNLRILRLDSLLSLLWRLMHKESKESWKWCSFGSGNVDRCAFHVCFPNHEAPVATSSSWSGFTTQERVIVRQFHHGSGSGYKSYHIVKIHRIQCGNVWKKTNFKSPQTIQNHHVYIFLWVLKVISTIPESANDGFAMAFLWRLGRTAGDTKASWTAAPEEGYERLRGSTVFFTYLRISQNGSIHLFSQHVTNAGWCWQVKPGETWDFVIWTYFYTSWCCKLLVSCVLMIEICMLAC